MKRSIAAVGLVSVAIVCTVSADEWRFLGPRTVGMGGAGVASTRGAWSLMCNPAGLAETDLGVASRVSFSTAVSIRDLGLIDSIDALSDYDWQEMQDDPAGNATNIANVVAELESMNRGKGLMVGVGGAAVGAYGGFGVGFGADFRASFRPSVDLTNVSSVADSANSFSNNTSAVHIKAIMLTEVPIGYAQKFDLGQGSISVGGALKIMRGTTYNDEVKPSSADSDDFKDSITETETTSMNVGLDLGAIYHPPVDGLSVGLVARNINSPKFDMAGGKIREEAQLRVGGEWAFWDRLLCVAVDADLNERDTILDGYRERWICGGVSVEGTPSIFALAARLGIMRNVAESDPGIIFTGGFSAGFKWFHLSVSGAMSNEESTMDETTIPSEATVMLSFEATW